MTRFKKTNATPCLLGIFAFCIFASMPARADSLSLYARVSQPTGLSCSDASAPVASCGYGSATGSLATGTLGALAQISFGAIPLPDSPTDTYIKSLSTASLVYNLVSSVANGTAVFTLGFDGTTSVTSTNPNSSSGLASTCSSAPCLAVADLVLQPGETFVGQSPTLQTETLALTQTNGLQLGIPSVQIATPISNGTSELSVELAASAECPILPLLSRAYGASCQADADFLDPLTITGASVYDANGNLVRGATLISQSGYMPLASTPEPSALLLFGTGLAFLGLLRRRFSQAPAN